MTDRRATLFGSTIRALEADDLARIRRPLPPETEFDFAAGEWRLRVPDEVRYALAETTRRSELGYSEPHGDSALREAFLGDLDGARASRHEIDVIITAGAKEGLWIALQQLVEEREPSFASTPNVLAPEPGWEPYRSWIKALNLRRVAYDPIALVRDPESVLGQPALKGAILVVNYPNNPTGVAASQEALNRIACAARRYGSAILADEVYRHYADELTSLAKCPDYEPRLDIIVDSASKWLAGAGLRVGFLVAAPERAARAGLFRTSYGSCPSGIGQQLALTLMQEPACRDWTASLQTTAAENISLLSRELASIGLAVESAGALYLWLKHHDISFNSNGIPAALVTDGATFGAAGYVRVCVARKVTSPHSAAIAIAIGSKS